jgi:hypothetical protein
MKQWLSDKYRTTPPPQLELWEAPSKNAQVFYESITSCCLTRNIGASLDWGKWDRIDRHCATITSGIEAFSLKIVAFLASQIPKLLRVGEILSPYLFGHMSSSSKPTPKNLHSICSYAWDYWTFMSILSSWKDMWWGYVRWIHLNFYKERISLNLLSNAYSGFPKLGFDFWRPPT